MNIDVQDKLLDVYNYLDRGGDLLGVLNDNYLDKPDPPQTFPYNYKTIQTLSLSAIYFLRESREMLEDILSHT